MYLDNGTFHITDYAGTTDFYTYMPSLGGGPWAMAPTGTRYQVYVSPTGNAIWDIGLAAPVVSAPPFMAVFSPNGRHRPVRRSGDVDIIIVLDRSCSTADPPSVGQPRRWDIARTAIAKLTTKRRAIHAPTTSICAAGRSSISRR
jgi:hypothetical protein